MISFDQIVLLFSTLLLLTKGQENSTDAGGRIRLQCGGTKMKASVNTTALFGVLQNGRNVALSLDDCDNSKYTIYGTTVDSDFQDCSSNITETKDHIIQEVKLTVETYANGSSNSNIIRGGQTIVFMLRCNFNRRLNVSKAEGVAVVEAEEGFTKKSVTNITAQMTFYTSDLFISKASIPLQVTDFEPIYIQITALENQQLFKFVVEDCYATPTENPMETNKYLYFEDKCPLDTTLQTYTQHTGFNKFSYSIQAFRFIRLKNQVFFHCRLLICKDGATTEECTQQCKTSRRRRRAVQEGVLERVYVNSGAVTYIEKPICPLNSRCYDLHPAYCRCNEGYVMNWKGQSCSKQNVLTLSNLHMDHQFIPSYSTQTSPQFLRFAQLVEQQLMTSYILQCDVIKGVKVIGLGAGSSGNVILDLQLLHSEAVTPQQAFDSFISMISQSEGNMKLLRIRTHMKPTLVKPKKDVKQYPTTLVVVVAAGVVMFVAAICVLSIILLLRKKRQDKKEEEKIVPTFNDNNGLQMNM